MISNGLLGDAVVRDLTVKVRATAHSFPLPILL